MNETDRELLIWAAKAIGMGPLSWTEPDGTKIVTNVRWNPIADDGDALRLAVKCRLEIGFPAPRKVWSFGRKGDVCSEEYKSDPLDATRRVIVRAAAEIGRNMK